MAILIWVSLGDYKWMVMSMLFVEPTCIPNELRQTNKKKMKRTMGRT